MNVPPSDLSGSMQLAAVEAAISQDGMSLEEVEIQHPNMAEGIRLYKEKNARRPRRRGDGSREPIALSPRPGFDI